MFLKVMSKITTIFLVETIGDAYMVASGVPEKTNHHASELAKMALDLLAKVSNFSSDVLNCISMNVTAN